MGYDIIGDIHGHNEKPEALLNKLGYRNTSGAWRHPDRRAIFVGDFIDRGPSQVQTVNTVRRMIEAGVALAAMGNHELNAIAWHTLDPANPGEYLRPHNSPKWGEENRKQHAAFLAEVEDKPALHAVIIDWFLENEADKDNATPTVFKAVEALTKGIEIPLPAGQDFRDKYGIRRNRVRVRWWDEEGTTYRSAAMLSSAERAALPDLPIPMHARVEPAVKPTFFGHYWLTGVPGLQSNRAVCVDYSAGNGGPLVAYRFEGERDLALDHFVSVA